MAYGEGYHSHVLRTAPYAHRTGRLVVPGLPHVCGYCEAGMIAHAISGRNAFPHMPLRAGLPAGSYHYLPGHAREDGPVPCWQKKPVTIRTEKTAQPKKEPGEIRAARLFPPEDRDHRFQGVKLFPGSREILGKGEQLSLFVLEGDNHLHICEHG